MNINRLNELIKKHEGLRLKPYQCTADKTTIGYGRNLTDKGITEEEAVRMLEHDLAGCAADLESIFPNHFQSLPENIQTVLMDMRFQLGYTGFRRFKKMIRAVHVDDPAEMIRQMKDSKWYHQVPSRAEDLIRMIDVFV